MMRRVTTLLAGVALLAAATPASSATAPPKGTATSTSSSTSSAKATSTSTGAKSNWSLGANFGMSFVDPELGSNSTVLAWPADGSATAYQPGIRVGYTKEKTPSEFYVDTGLAYMTGGGFPSTSFELTANYQYNFNSKQPKSLNPYLTGGFGMVSASYDYDVGSGPDGAGATSLIYGLGVGLRHRISDGHGTIRAEFRFDHLTEGDDTGLVIIDSSNIIGIKLGFDIWMK
jgi:hypothetical protein